MDVVRVRPAQDANEVALEQVKAFVLRSSEKVVAPLFVFDAGYDPVKLQRGLEGSRGARSSSACGRGAASTATLASLSATHRRTSGVPAATGRR